MPNLEITSAQAGKFKLAAPGFEAEIAFVSFHKGRENWRIDMAYLGLPPAFDFTTSLEEAIVAVNVWYENTNEFFPLPEIKEEPYSNEWISQEMAKKY